MARDVRASCKMEEHSIESLLSLALASLLLAVLALSSPILEARSLRCLARRDTSSCWTWRSQLRRDYYALLDIPRSATTRQIRSGYQWAAAKWHPQKNPGAKVEAQSRFRDIAEAYDVLIDPLRRQQFDAHGEVGLKNPPHDADFEPYQYVGDPFELFNQFFSSADPLSVAYEPELEDLPVLPSMPKEPTIEMEIECTLGELKEGSTRCVVVERTRLGPGFLPYQEKKPVTLPIRPGWQAGMRIIFKGAGNHSHKDNQPGDLAVCISQKAQPA
eukprot:s5242_g3.t1